MKTIDKLKSLNLPEMTAQDIARKLNITPSYVYILSKKYGLKIKRQRPHHVEIIKDWKICKKCDEIKHISEFGKNSTMADGHINTCKKCISNYNATRYRKNAEHINKVKKKWQEKNREKHLQYRRDYYKRKKKERENEKFNNN